MHLQGRSHKQLSSKAVRRAFPPKRDVVYINILSLLFHGLLVLLFMYIAAQVRSMVRTKLSTRTFFRTFPLQDIGRLFPRRCWKFHWRKRKKKRFRHRAAVNRIRAILTPETQARSRRLCRVEREFSSHERVTKR